MATNTLKKLFQAQLGVADTLMYTAPPLVTTTIVALYKTNTDSTARTFRLFQVSGGGSANATNALYYNEPIAANRTHARIDTGIVLEPGQMLRGLASVAAVVTLTGFGIESEETV